MVKGIYENGFLLLIIPSYGADFMIICYRNSMIAFTNYDFQHLPNKLLISYLANFTNIWSLSNFPFCLGSVLSDHHLGFICLNFINQSVSSQPLQSNYLSKETWCYFLLPYTVAFITILIFSNMFNDSVESINTFKLADS